ncbi:uncharacterized protein LOC128260477 [Drosophila gunungcola]|uniref:CG8661 protein n=1 Tax=Drosophila gunungcola TaxID=103775 RepID=A0A9P9YFH1_9MUSC|nr:uncharacterized protein LOC128260477 [Drosophila gunungcola]KAI8036041.1 hypothetical protein M5D96_011135 [Drosophila gunungcola]
MKYTILAFAVCLLCVNALVVPYPREDSSPDLIDLSDGDVAVEDFFFLNKIYKALKIALRSIKGLNCVLKWVAGIEDSAKLFNRNVLLCGATASKEVTNLINANLNIISTCNDIINLKTNVCVLAEGEEPNITNSCFVNTLRKVWSLKKQIDKAVKLAKKIPQTGPKAAVCVNDAVNTLTTYYTAFPQNMITCSQLTS